MVYAENDTGLENDPITENQVEHIEILLDYSIKEMGYRGYILEFLKKLAKAI